MAAASCCSALAPCRREVHVVTYALFPHPPLLPPSNFLSLPLSPSLSLPLSPSLSHSLSSSHSPPFPSQTENQVLLCPHHLSFTQGSPPPSPHSSIPSPPPISSSIPPPLTQLSAISSKCSRRYLASRGVQAVMIAWASIVSPSLCVRTMRCA